MRALGYIQTINFQCEPVGDAHIAVQVGKGKPVLACGTDAGAMNWTLNPKTKQPVCKRCRSAIERSK